LASRARRDSGASKREGANAAELLADDGTPRANYAEGRSRPRTALTLRLRRGGDSTHKGPTLTSEPRSFEHQGGVAYG